MTSADLTCDLLVIGGGINGAGIARDAVGRGLSVVLVEAEDLASHTSSASTKLIHGGLRYLEYGEFRLVREALIERERLLGMAPHIIWPLTFVLPHRHAPRPAWMVRLGLWLYDHLGGRKKLPASRRINLNRSAYGAGLNPGPGTAFTYADCWVEDSRLVALNAIDAAERGATVLTRTRLLAAHREGADGWLATIAPADDTSNTRRVHARAVVNAAGPWVAEVLGRLAGAPQNRGVRLIKGSHIVVPQLYPGDHAFLLQNPDKRVVFTVPYEGRFTLIGTTDVAWTQAPGKAQIDADEVTYLCESATRYFARAVTPADVVWSYAGIRPLYDDHAANASAVTRDYVLDLDAGPGKAPVLSVFGGKITTYRKLAEHALDKLAPHLAGTGAAWTGGVALPGGDWPGGDFDALVAELTASSPDVAPGLVRRLARAYGSRARAILAAGLGDDLGGGLCEGELRHLVMHEFVRSADDVLWRRSKLGLHVPEGTAERVAAWLAANPPA